MNRILRIALLAAACTAALAAGASAAQAKQHRYVGEHPVAGGGFCHIEAPHVHVYAAAKADVLYRQHDGWLYFVGDPVAYGYVGPKFAYQNPHPIHVDVMIGETEIDGDELEYCYLRGPHYHIDAPPPETHFSLRGEMYWYTGDFAPEFEQERPRLARINVVYEPIVYARPALVVDPPQGWVDVYFVSEAPPPPPPPPPVEASFGFGVGVDVHVPVPVVEVRVGGPVYVEDHRHGGGVKVKAKPGKRHKGHGNGHFKGKW